MKKNRFLALLLVLSMLLALAACGGDSSADGTTAANTAASETREQPEEAETTAPQPAADAPEISGLTFEAETPLSYAQCFRLFRYEGGYTLIRIENGGDFLVVPENGTTPEGLSADITVLQLPLNKIYLAATSAMALFNAVGGIDAIRMTGIQASGWYVDAAVDALDSGKMLFAGKYSAPDYEMLIDEDCDLAIESTMIYHTPKVKEMIEDLGIPVLVDRSSYEGHPLGRTEWVKLYAVLVGKEAEAESCFNEQAAVIQELESFENTGKSVAFFYVNSDGSVVIRKPTDYIPKMIHLAGGVYCFDDLQTDQAATSISIDMETFYAAAADADVLIYNASISAPITSTDELVEMNSLFADFKAVKEGNVWCTGKSFYQATDIVGQMIRDIHLALTGGDPASMTFLSHVS